MNTFMPWGLVNVKKSLRRKSIQFNSEQSSMVHALNEENNAL